MSLFATIMTAAGVILSSISGLICYLGDSPSYSALAFVPDSQILLNHPEASLTVGAFLIFLGLFSAPSRT